MTLRARTFKVGRAVVAVAAVTAVSVAAAGIATAAGAEPGLREGTTATGVEWRFSVRGEPARRQQRTCVRLAFRRARDTTSTGTCGTARTIFGRIEARGDLECATGDLFVYGLMPNGIRTLQLRVGGRSSETFVVRAPGGRGRGFLLILPRPPARARVVVERRDGSIARRTVRLPPARSCGSADSRFGILFL